MCVFNIINKTSQYVNIEFNNIYSYVNYKYAKRIFHSVYNQLCISQIKATFNKVSSNIIGWDMVMFHIGLQQTVIPLSQANTEHAWPFYVSRV